MKAVIVYYSMSGNTASTAEKIAAALDADLLRIDPVKNYPDKGFRKFFWGGKSAVMGETPALQPYGFEADKYDLIIIGTPVWAANITPPVRSFIKEQKTALIGKKIAAFACQSGNGAEKAFTKLEQYLEGDPLRAKLILTEPVDSRANIQKIKDFCDILTAQS